jgi:hypothetical protein
MRIFLSYGHDIREAYNAMFEKLFDAGVFERKLGTLEATIRNLSIASPSAVGAHCKGCP